MDFHSHTLITSTTIVNSPINVMVVSVQGTQYTFSRCSLNQLCSAFAIYARPQTSTSKKMEYVAESQKENEAPSATPDVLGSGT